MGRRGIHDEGSRTLQERLKGKVRVDFETAPGVSRDLRLALEGLARGCARARAPQPCCSRAP